VKARNKLEVLESTSGDTGEINLWRTEEISREKCDYLFALLVRVLIFPYVMVIHTQVYKFFSFSFVSHSMQTFLAAFRLKHILAVLKV
jgi:hypothetical protein